MARLNIKRFVCNMLQENCYVVDDGTGECVIIDCGAYYEEERKAVTEHIHANGLTPKHLLTTHGHLDHNFGNDTIYETFGLRPEVSTKDNSLMENLERQAETFYGLKLDRELPHVGKYLCENDTITFGNHTLTIIETPGHSPGSVCYYCKEEDVLFSGDTLFRHSIGRTDFGGGSMLQMIQSLRRLAQLPDNTAVFPGHGQQTTLSEELAHNPYMDR